MWSLLACLYFVIQPIANASYILSLAMHPSCELQQVLLLSNVLFKAEKAKQSWRLNGYPHPLSSTTTTQACTAMPTLRYEVELRLLQLAVEVTVCRMAASFITCSIQPLWIGC